MQSILDFRRREPFQPFRIRTKDGKIHRVPAPNHIAVSEFQAIVIDENERLGFITPENIEAVEPDLESLAHIPH